VGVPCVYFSTTLSLAILEVLVHTDSDLMPDDMVALRVEVADLAEEETALDDLPAEWLTEIGNADTQAFGGQWVKERRSPLLVLPSVVLPLEADAPEKNVLLNPGHPAAQDIEVAELTPFSFDPRLISP